jgi:hypothetical protein
MRVKQGMHLTKGSEYRIFSVGAKDSLIETKGIFRGYVTLGIDDVGLCIEFKKGGKKSLRIIPLPVVVAIDVVSEVSEGAEKEEESIHYYS